MAKGYRDVPGFPGYRAGTDGSVWSCWVRAKGKARGLREMGGEWSELKGTRDVRGRVVVKLCRAGRVHRLFVHRVVLATFVGPCPPGMQACHFPDRSLSNNALANLRWDTPVSNMADKEVHGTSPKGENNPRAKLTVRQIGHIRGRVAAGVPRRRVAAEHGVARSTIDLIVGGVTWRGV